MRAILTLISALFAFGLPMTTQAETVTITSTGQGTCAASMGYGCWWWGGAAQPAMAGFNDQYRNWFYFNLDGAHLDLAHGRTITDATLSLYNTANGGLGATATPYNVYVSESETRDTVDASMTLDRAVYAGGLPQSQINTGRDQFIDFKINKDGIAQLNAYNVELDAVAFVGVYNGDGYVFNTLGNVPSKLTLTIGPAVSPVPEPSQISLLAVGGLALLAVRRKQRA